MSDDEVNAKDEMIDNVDGAGSSGDESAKMDQEVNDIEELEGEAGKKAEDGKVDTVKGAVGEKNDKEKLHGEEHKGPGMENVEGTVELKDKGKKDERESGENSGEEEGDEGSERMDDDMEDEENEEVSKEERNKKPRHRGRVGLDADKEKKDKRRSRHALEIPFSFSPDRPVRERKAVVRLVEVIEKEQDEGVHVEKGHGTPLKNIPNVARKLSKIKPEDLKLLHMILFGRKGKAADFKSHILKFSGFVWHENEEKQKTKVQEKLDKCTKDQLLDLCDVLDVPVSSTPARKEDLIVTLLDFMIAPHVSTTDILLSESKQQSTSTSKRRKSSQAVSPSSSAKHHRKKRKMSEDASNFTKVEAEVEDSNDGGVEERRENDFTNGHENAQHSEREDEHISSNSAEEDILKAVKFDKKKKKVISKQAKKSSLKKVSDAQDKHPETVSEHLETKEMGGTSKVFSRRKKADATCKKNPTTSKLQSGPTNTGEKLGKRKRKLGKMQNSSPSNEEVRKMICQILKDVDFNTATFNDILLQLGIHYKIDMMPRKQSIKSIVKEELTKLAEAEVEQEGVNDSSDGSDENAQFSG